MKKLPTIKSLEKKAWELCKQIVRKKYKNSSGNWTCYSCGEPIYEAGKCHTGHFMKKGSLPMALKYDLRILRPQCVGCNLFKDGNESAYAIHLLKDHGEKYLLQLDEDVKYHKGHTMGTMESREFLQNLIEEYKKILDQ